MSSFSRRTQNDDDDDDNVGTTASTALTILPDAIDEDDGVTFASIGVKEQLFSEPFRLLKWDKPTRIQAAVLPEAFAKRDVIALAETGSG
jgi:superfamily II DNA/RNA helicase